MAVIAFPEVFSTFPAGSDCGSDNVYRVFPPRVTVTVTTFPGFLVKFPAKNFPGFFLQFPAGNDCDNDSNSRVDGLVGGFRLHPNAKT